MLSYPISPLRRSLPRAIFERLRNLWQRMAELVGEGAVILTEDLLLSVEISPEQRVECFTLLISKRFSALLSADSSIPIRIQSEQAIASAHVPLTPPSNLIEVGLTFEPEAIAAFLNQLVALLKHNPHTLGIINRARLMLQPNDARLQSEFTLSLLEILALESHHTPSEPVHSYVSVCQPVENALRQQVEQERLLNQITTQIRQGLDLNIILATAVEQVRNFLQVDRLVIYQFRESQSQQAGEQLSNPAITQHSLLPLNSGRVTYEARASKDIPSVLNVVEKERCFFSDLSKFREQYSQSSTQAITDIENAYISSPCFLELMRQMPVRAKLIAPIVIQDKLWGLLIAHQCFEPRQWLDSEKNFLGHIAEYLALAIAQAHLYAQLQQQKRTLEQRVIERTQALHDALLAAQAANLAKSEFLAIMSHELRTPLTSVIGLSATLLRSSGGLLGKAKDLPLKKQQDYLETIHSSGQHLLELINDILDLSQVEAGKAILNISEFSLVKLAKQALHLFVEKARNRGVKLEIDIKVGQENLSRESADSASVLTNVASFRADKHRVRQILFNILGNAIKFTPAGGQVTLRVWQEGNTAVLQVEDTGIGIPKHQLPLLFQKFQQLESSYNRTYEGTGVGLALTKQLVELHGGRIEVESTLGVGSTFTVSLPSQSSIEELRSKDDTEDSSIHQGSIVLVEEQEEVATLICDILTAAGYHMVWLIDGFTAVSKIELLQPVAVIVDMRSPGVDGCEISKSLRNSSATQHIKIIVLTETYSRKYIELCTTAGADDYLLKPVQPKQLLDKVLALTKISLG